MSSRAREHEADKAAADALAALARLLAPLVGAELAKRSGTPEADPWEPIGAYLKIKGRAGNELGRSGRLATARKVGRVWLARRSDLDAYVEALASQRERRLPIAPAANDDATPTADEVLASVGFARVAGGRR
jgi:hypothetical protein